MKIFVCLTGALICFISCSFGQTDSALNTLTQLPNRLFAKINNKTSSLDNQLTRQTERYLAKMQRKEERLRQKLYKTDSSAAKQLYGANPDQQYAALLQKFKTDSARIVSSMGAEYLPYADSLQGSLSFLNKNPQLLNSKLVPANIQNSLNQVQLLQAKMEDADQIKAFMAERKAQIQQYITRFSHLPPGVSNLYSDYNKELYYYNAQLQAYRDMLNDPGKMMQTALLLLNKIPAFTTFMKNKGFLAGLFNIPGDYGTAEAMTGLQSRDQVLALIQSQIGAGGSNASSALQNSLQTAQQDISKLQDKLSTLGAGSGNVDMPDFKPNNQKTKTFLKRLVYEINTQTQSASNYYPTTTDLGLSLGFKIDDKNTIGIGSSLRIGWGSDIQHIHVSSQGAGLRSFIDIQAKKSFYISGGFEYNYQVPLVSTGFYPKMNNWTNWQKSGLIGISKIVSMNTKVFKKTKVSFLWDFISYQQLPRPAAFLFRIGYSL